MILGNDILKNWKIFVTVEEHLAKLSIGDEFALSLQYPDPFGVATGGDEIFVIELLSSGE